MLSEVDTLERKAGAHQIYKGKEGVCSPDLKKGRGVLTRSTGRRIHEGKESPCKRDF